MPKISVIIPVYNVEKYLRECLDSVINQTLKDIEIICVNDGSPDKSIDILREYEQKDNRIVVIDKKNEGVGITRNKGIDIAKGEFVCFMDPDDLYPTDDILEVLCNKAVENNVKICGGEFSKFVDGTHYYRQDFSCSLNGYLFDKDGIVNYKDYQFDYGYHRFIYKREFLLGNSIYFPSYKRFQDPPFFVNAMINAGIFYAVDKVTYGYRYGHTEVKWTSEKINDLLLGLLDDMSYAKKYDLKKLELYTKKRFKEHYKLCGQLVNVNTLKMCFCIMGVSLFFAIFAELLRRMLQTFFSIKNRNQRKVITILGVKIKIKRNKK